MNLMHSLMATPVGRSLGLLTIETTLFLLAGLLIGRFLRSAIGLRTLWQTVFLAQALLAGMECCGVGAALSGWRPRRPAPSPESLAGSPAELRVSVPAPNIRLRGQPDPALAAPRAPAAETSGRGPAPSLSRGAWPVWVWLSGAMAMAAWTVLTRLTFAALVRRHPVTDHGLLGRVQALQAQLGMGRPVRVTEIDGLTGPIAHGMLRAEISVAPGFTERYTAAQQSAMLAHELAHLAARDPQWHFLGDLVAALWWWHPLVWVARRRFREASETSADEASLVVPDGPGALAECLVSLGRELSRTRFAGNLGVSGRSFRSGLGRRVSRLEVLCLHGGVWPGARRGRLLTWRAGGALGLVAMTLTATALAGGEVAGPDGVPGAFRRSLIGLALGALAQTEPARARPEVVGASIRGDAAADGRPATNGPPESYVIQQGDTLARLVDALRRHGRAVTQRAVIDANPGVNWQRLRVGQPIVLPAVALGDAAPRPAGPAAAAPLEIPRPAPKRSDTVTARGVVEPAQAGATEAAPPVARALPAGQVSPVGQTLPVGQAVAVANAANGPPLHTRWFKLEPQALRAALRDWLGKGEGQPQPGVTAEALMQDLRRFLAAAGVDLSAPGRQCTYNERGGMLMVSATLAELDLVERAVQVMNTAPSQLMLEVKLCEIAEEAIEPLRRNGPGGKLLGPVLRGAGGAAGEAKTVDALKAILTEAETRSAVGVLEQQRGVNVLSAPKLTTLSGRQAQVKSVQERYIVTDVDFSTNGANAGVQDVVTIQPITERFELGPVVDLLPQVLPDQRTVALTVGVRIREFEGYENEAGMKAAVQRGGETRTSPSPLPKFRLREVSASALVRDGHTLVLAGGTTAEEKGGSREFRRALSPKAAAEAGRPTRSRQRMTLLILVTPTLIDAAGNRLPHGDP